VLEMETGISMLKNILLVAIITFSLNDCSSGIPKKSTEPDQRETNISRTETVILTDDTEVNEDEVKPEPTRTSETEAMGIQLSDLVGVRIEFWHGWSYGERAEGMAVIVDEFNDRNEWGIYVEQKAYEDVNEAYHDAVQNDELPNAILYYPNVLADWYIKDNVVDLNSFINDPVVGLTEEGMADYYQSALYSASFPSGEWVGFPFSQAVTVLFYNTTWAQELGFENPPQTSTELNDQACVAAEANNEDDDPNNDGTGGMVFYPGVPNIMSWIFAFGDDGLAEDGASYDFTSHKVQDVAVFLKEMWDEGCSFATERYSNPEFATRKALFTMDNSADLHYQIAAFESEDGTDDEWILIPFPGPNGKKAINSIGQMAGIIESAPEGNLAAWLFLKYIISLDAQVQWSTYSGFYPVRKSAKDLLEDYKTEHPQWGTGLELLEYGQTEPNMASWGSVRWAVFDAFEDIIYSQIEDIPSLLDELDLTATELVAEIDR